MGLITKKVKVMVVLMVQCSAVQFSAVVYNAVVYGTMQCSKVEQCSAVKCSAVQYSSAYLLVSLLLSAHVKRFSTVCCMFLTEINGF